jgi:citrate lyase synthetase
MEIIFVESKSIIAAHKRLQLFRKETDLISVRKLIHKTIESCYSAYYDTPVVQFIKEFYNNENITEHAKNGYMLVYFIDGKVVGTGSLNEHRINGLFVDPALQGRGIGRRIMYSLLCEAEKQSLKILEVQSTPGSVIFFERNGFQTVTEEMIWVENIFPMPLNLMEKRLP